MPRYKSDTGKDEDGCTGNSQQNLGNQVYISLTIRTKANFAAFLYLHLAL